MAENLCADVIPPKFELEEAIEGIFLDKGLEELKIWIDKIIGKLELLKPEH